MKRKFDIGGWPVMTARCASCPFNPDGDIELRSRVEERLISASQICHHPRLHGKRENHLCRGARDVQIQIMHRLGYIDTPDDAGWNRAASKNEKEQRHDDPKR